MEIALAVESATKGARDIISGMSDSTPVHNMSDKTPPMIKCSHCGRGNHNAIECYLKNTTCRKCGRKGHIEQVCHSKAHDTGSQAESTREKSFQTNEIFDSTNTSGYSENSEEYTLFTIQNAKDSTKPLIVTMTLNDKKVLMEIDTGSAVTILPEATYRAISTDPYKILQ